MEKLSEAQVGQMLKEAAATVRALSEERQTLKTKVAHYEKKERAEKIAAQMDEKRLQSDLSFTDKVRGLMGRDDLDVVEEAVGLTAPQMKLASVAEEAGYVSAGSSDDASMAESAFVQNLLASGE